MTALIIGAIIVVAGGLIAAGYRVGKDNSPPTVSSPTGADSGDCRQACSAWDNARQMSCSAKSDESAARSRADGIRGQLLAAIAAAVALGVAAGAALGAVGAATGTIIGIPAALFLIRAAIALIVASALAWATAAFLTGELAAAEIDAAAKARARQGWDTAVVATSADVNSKCSLVEANACLSRSAPC
jgi:hypothetical protein